MTQVQAAQRVLAPHQMLTVEGIASRNGVSVELVQCWITWAEVIRTTRYMHQDWFSAANVISIEAQRGPVAEFAARSGVELPPPPRKQMLARRADPVLSHRGLSIG